LAHRLTALRFRLCGNQISDAFGRGKVDPAVQECSASELAGLRRTSPCFGKSSRNGRNHRGSTVKVQFSGILAGEATRSRKLKNKCFIQQLAVDGMAQATNRGLAGPRKPANNGP
jgi:hypothetical protein